MMNRIISFCIMCVLGAHAHGQFNLRQEKELKVDTLYFPFQNDVQLVVINAFDAYSEYGRWYDAMYPRSGSWFMDHGPIPYNVYLFRNRAGEIIRSFNSVGTFGKPLRPADFVNAQELSLYRLEDYRSLHRHLRFYNAENKTGLINTLGEVVLPAKYDEIRVYQDPNGKRDKIIIIENNQFGMLDSTINELFPPIYRMQLETNYVGYPEHNTMGGDKIKVFKGNKCGLISETGKVLIDFKYDAIKPIHDSMYMAQIHRSEKELEQSTKGHWNWGYLTKSCVIYDKDFRVFKDFGNYEYLYYYGTSRIIAKKNGKFGVLNTAEEVIVPCIYETLVQEDGVYYVKLNNRTGILDLDGKQRIPIEFQQIDWYGDAIYVTKDGLIGVYDTQFNCIAPPQFTNRTWNMGKYILTKADGSSGFVKHEKDKSYYQAPDGKITKLP